MVHGFFWASLPQQSPKGKENKRLRLRVLVVLTESACEFVNWSKQFDDM